MLRSLARSTLVLQFATLLIASSTRGGVIFLPQVQIDATTQCCLRCPAAARTASGTLCAIWVESLGPGYSPYLLMSRRSTDGGLTWPGPSLRINEGNTDVGHTALAAGAGEDLLAVWAQSFTFWFARSEDGGASWSPPVEVDPGGWNFGGPTLAAAGDIVIIGCWTQGSVMDPPAPAVIVSEDRGETWSPPRAIDMTFFPSEWDGNEPRIAWDPMTGTLGMLVSTLGEELLFLSSTSLGQSWTFGERVNDADPTSLGGPDMIAAAGRFHFVWSDNRNGSVDVWYSRTQDGIHFKTNKQVDEDLLGYQFEPQIAIGSDGVLHACWFSHELTGSEIRYSRSSDGGDDWLVPGVRVNEQEGSAESWWFQAAELLLDGPGDALVFWRDAPGGQPAPAHLVFRRTFSASTLDPWQDPSPATTHLRITGNPGPNPRIHLVGGPADLDRSEAPGGGLVLELYRVTGERVSMLPLQRDHVDGLSAHFVGNRQLPSGMYFARLRGGERGEMIAIVR